MTTTTTQPRQTKATASSKPSKGNTGSKPAGKVDKAPSQDAALQAATDAKAQADKLAADAAKAKADAQAQLKAARDKVKAAQQAAKDAAKAAKVPGVNPAAKTRPAIAGKVIAQHGLKAGVTDDMIKQVNQLYDDGKSANDTESTFALRNAWHAINGYLTAQQASK